jgi:hypothetical protein
MKTEFEYAGGGYFREKGIAKGKVAKIVHAPELMKELQERINKLENELVDAACNEEKLRRAITVHPATG